MSDIIKTAQERYRKDKDYWKPIYQKALEDLRFLSDAEDAQWTSAEYNKRKREGRPCLTIDQLGQFVHQVANDIRMNTPTINIIPSGAESSVETAEIFKGLIKNIEYTSNADEAYDTASLNAIKCSIGFIRIDHDYESDTGFEQELTIHRVVNPLACLLDSNSTECDGSDARHGTFIDRITVAEFKRRFPNRPVTSFTDEKEMEYSKDEEFVDIAEFFEIVEETKEVILNQDGEMQEYTEGVEFKSKRPLKKIRVKRYIMSGSDLLEETTFPGKYIPIIPVYGEEAWIEGRRELHSLIRKSKDAQRMYNYWKSLETELLMKQPKAPIMAVAGTVEDFAEDWKDPDKAAVLRYKATDAQGNPSRAPERLAPPAIPTGIVNAARMTVDDIKATMGLYNASIGARSNETSGIAIERRNQEGDVATFHFSDNLVRSITHVGRVLVCAIPDIYDTARVIRIIGMEDEPEQIGINGAMVAEQDQPFDLTRGKYDVRVVTGASYTTKRQESAAFFTSIVEKQPQLMEVMGDLLFKNMDFTGAQAMAERMKKVIDPKFLEENKEEEVDPEKEQMALVIQQGEQILADLQAQLAETQEKLDSKEAELQIKAGSELAKAELERDKLKLEMMKIQNDEANKQMEIEFKMAALRLKDKELNMKAVDMQRQHIMQSSESSEIEEPDEMQQESGISPDS